MRKTAPKTHRYCDLTPPCHSHAANTHLGRLSLDEAEGEEVLDD